MPILLAISTSGCVYVVLKMLNGKCATLPNRGSCESTDYNFSPDGDGDRDGDAPGIDTSSPKLQHIVVSFRSFIGDNDVNPVTHPTHCIPTNSL